MNATCVQPNALWFNTDVIAGIIHRLQAVCLEDSELSHLSRMSARAKTASCDVDCVERLFKLRTMSRKRRAEERRARSHWFNKVVPMYQERIDTQFLPVTTHSSEFYLLAGGYGDTERLLTARDDSANVRRLPGPATRALAG